MIKGKTALVAGRPHEDGESNTEQAHRRRQEIEAASVLVLWGGNVGPSPEAIGEACYAASRGIPYAIVMGTAWAGKPTIRLLIFGAQIVLGLFETVEQALPIVEKMVGHNPKGDQLFPSSDRVPRLLGKSESPIEERLAIHLACAIEHSSYIFAQHGVETEAGSFRLDFAIDPDGARIAVECDGHEWHERTKEQAARDKSRDRALVAAGWRVIRFTGSEIWADPRRCALEVSSLLNRGGA